jgi:hypothetical protein
MVLDTSCTFQKTADAWIVAVCMYTFPQAAATASHLPAGLRVIDLSADTSSWMRFVYDDAGSHAHDDLQVYQPKFGFWFGHTAVNK